MTEYHSSKKIQGEFSCMKGGNEQLNSISYMTSCAYSSLICSHVVHLCKDLWRKQHLVSLCLCPITNLGGKNDQPINLPSTATVQETVAKQQFIEEMFVWKHAHTTSQILPNDTRDLNIKPWNLCVYSTAMEAASLLGQISPRFVHGGKFVQIRGNPC